MNPASAVAAPIPSESRPLTRAGSWWLLVGVLVAGSALRLALLGSKSLWFDETFSVSLASRSLAEMWQLSTYPGADPHPRLYVTLLHYWMQYLGRSELAVRLPTAFASVLNLALLAALATRLFDRRTALVATALLAVAPLEVWYAQEARMYMIVATCGLFFAVFLTVRSWAAFPGLLLSLTIGLYVDHPMVPLSLGLSVLFLIYWWQHGREPRRLATWAAAVLGAWLLYLPIMPFLAYTFEELNRIFVFREVRDALGLPAFRPWHYLAAMFAIAGLIGLASLIGQRLLQRRGFRRWAGPLIVAGYAVVTLLIPIPRLFGIERVLVTGWPYVVLLVAWLITADARLWRYALAPLLIVSAVAALAALLVPKDDWRGAIATINAESAGDGILWVDPGWNNAAASYYDVELPIRRGSLDDLARAKVDVWIVAERFPDLPVPSSPAEAWLDANRRLLETYPFYRLEVRRYGAP